MTYTHLATNELVMIETYYQEGATVRDIVASLYSSKIKNSRSPLSLNNRF